MRPSNVGDTRVFRYVSHSLDDVAVARSDAHDAVPSAIATTNMRRWSDATFVTAHPRADRSCIRSESWRLDRRRKSRSPGTPSLRVREDKPHHRGPWENILTGTPSAFS